MTVSPIKLVSMGSDDQPELDGYLQIRLRTCSDCAGFEAERSLCRKQVDRSEPISACKRVPADGPICHLFEVIPEPPEPEPLHALEPLECDDWNDLEF